LSIKFNPFTGNFDFVGGSSTTAIDNFSYETIPDGITVTIPDGQQMLLKGNLNILGDLIIQGTLQFITDTQNQFPFYSKILSNEVVVVPPDRLLLYKDFLIIEGHLRNQGRVETV
jgi:hypothetical protein